MKTYSDINLVKQSIGRANILPWSSIWKKDYSPHGQPIGDRYKTPAGGLLLEWVGMIVLVSATAVIPGTMESVQLPGNIQTYAECCTLGMLTPDTEIISLLTQQ